MGSLDALHHTESRQYDPMLTVLEMTPPASPVDLIYLHAQYEQAAALHELEGGDISGILAQAMKKAVSISAPTFFATNTDLFQDSIAAIQFGFAGVVVVPCAVPIVPIGVGIFPQVWLVKPGCMVVNSPCHSSASVYATSGAMCIPSYRLKL